MAFNRDDNNVVLTPDAFDDVWYQPLREASTALQTFGLRSTGAKTFRIPVVTADAAVDFVAEGAEISETQPTVTEVGCTPVGIKGITKISRELLDDSDNAARVVSESGLIQQIANKIDESAYGTVTSAGATLAPAGLNTLHTMGSVSTVDVDTYTSLDPFLEAMGIAELTGQTVTSFVAHPSTVLTLLKLKESTGSNRGLITPDATVRPGRTIQGVPLWSSAYVTANVVWAISANSALAVLRTPAELAFSDDYGFSSYSVGVRAVQRFGLVYPNPAAIVRIGPVA